MGLYLVSIWYPKQPGDRKLRVWRYAAAADTPAAACALAAVKDAAPPEACILAEAIEGALILNLEYRDTKELPECAVPVSTVLA
jgi:hypothetical protein